MSNIDYYTELIQKLTIRLNEVEEENLVLREKLMNCEGKLEVLNLFYSDFKHLIRTDDVLPVTSADTKPKPNYNTLLSSYFVTNDAGIVELLFNDYGVNPAMVLTDIRNKLPDNIKNIVKKYKCEKEYQIILKSVEHVKNFSFDAKGMSEISDCYIDCYINHKKTTALKYLKQALVYFPFQFNEFMENIREYRYDNFDEYVEKLKFELYGEGNILLTGIPIKLKGKKRGRKPKKREEVIISEKPKTEKNLLDYSKLSVSELIEIVKNVETNKRQKALRAVVGMERAKRSDDDCRLFKNEVNKLLGKKI